MSATSTEILTRRLPIGCPRHTPPLSLPPDPLISALYTPTPLEYCYQSNMHNLSSLMIQTMLMVVSRHDGLPLGFLNATNTTAQPLEVTDTTQFPTNGTRCYPPYGCFSDEFPWTSIARPVSYLPESPERIDPHFCLYRWSSTNECYRLRPDNDSTIINSVLDPKEKVTFISHGYLENHKKPWMLKMKDELLKYDKNMNVIVIGWGGGSQPPYAQAVANIRLVGAMGGHLVKKLCDFGVNIKKVHVIGHSLGSHLASYMGHTLQEKWRLKLGRISGLDPAEPHFTQTPPIVRLDPFDADFVDVVHTDAAPFISGGLGLKEPVGHLDFYPNGGVSQPGCSEGMMSYLGGGSSDVGNLFKGIRQFVSCNHIRAYEYYTESINSKCPFAAIECSSYEAFLNGSCFKCTDKLNSKGLAKKGEYYCTQMGYHAKPDPRQQPSQSHLKAMARWKVPLYLITGPKDPFCRKHYKVTFHMSSHAQSQDHGGEVGKFRLILKEGKKVVEEISLSPRESFFEPGSQHSFVVSSKCTNDLSNVEMKWIYEQSLFNPFSWRIVTTPQIYLDWITVDNLEGDPSLSYCNPPGKPILSNEVIPLIENNKCKEYL